MLLAWNALLAIVGAYAGGLTAVAWWSRLRGAGTTSVADRPATRFVVLVPAHDEAKVIGETLDSLAVLDYPSDLYRVHVVADNCTEDTADIARSRGATVHERTAPDAPGKGPALMWLLHRLWQRDEPHDAVAIIDADTVVSRDFLRIMDACLSRGEPVIQAYYAVRDPDASWVVALRYAALAARHHLRPLARTAVGSSAGLHGNGMVLRADVMRRHAWTDHLTEDIELEVELLLAGERVTFAPDAVVRAEMPQRLDEAISQNARWERGRMQLVRDHVPRLVRAAAHGSLGHRLRCVDAAVDHVVPPLSVTAAAMAVAATASTAFRFARPTRLSRLNLRLALGTAATLAAYVASALHMVEAPASVWRALRRAPLFVLWKLRLWLGAFAVGDDVPWLRTSRNP